MASVPLAALAIRPVEQPDMLGNYAKLVQLKGLMQEQQQRQQLMPLQVQQAQGALQLQNLQMQEAQRTLERNQAMDSAFSDGAYTIGPDGTATINRQKLYDHLNASNAGSLIPEIETKLSTLDKTHADTQKALADTQKAQGETQAASADYLGSIGATIKASNYDPVVAATTLGHAAALGGPYAQQAKDMLTHLQQNPQNIQQMTDEMIAASPKQVESQLKQTQIQTAQTELPGKQAQAYIEQQKANALMSYLAKNPGKTQADFEVSNEGRKASAEAYGRLGAEKDLAQFNFNLQQGLLPNELKGVAPHLVGPAAAQYTKVTQDYLGAKQGADDMQTIIDLARSGNIIGYSYAPTTGVMQFNTTQGIKRVNMAEIRSYGPEGWPVYDRVLGFFGKVISGKSIPDAILSDMEQAHQSMARNSQAKYESGIDATNKAYNSSFTPLQPKEAVDRGLIGPPQPGEQVKYNSAGHGIVYRGNKWVDPATGQEVK